jgi:hypothetical protein
VQVHIGTTSAPDLKCLNAALQGLSAQAAGRAATMTQAQSRPTSLAPTQVGLYNQTATRERLGNAFGHFPFPQRPESTYVVPLLH